MVIENAVGNGLISSPLETENEQLRAEKKGANLSVNHSWTGENKIIGTNYGTTNWINGNKRPNC